MGLLDKFKEIITENDDDLTITMTTTTGTTVWLPRSGQSDRSAPGTSGRLSRSARNALAAEDGTIRWSISTPPPSCRWCW